MKKILFLLTGFSSLLHSQTSVAPGNVSGTWTPAGSPYNVTGSIMVAAGSTLVIQPGVTVNFQGHYKLLVKGTLVAVGSPGNEITFTAANAATGWYGLRIDAPGASQDSTLLKHCIIERGIANGSGDDEKGGGVFVKNFSKVSIHSCTITSNKANLGGGGIYCEGSTILIKNNVVSNNTNSGIWIYDSNLSITENLVTNNTRAGIFTSFSTVIPTVSIVSNTISGNSNLTAGGGIYFGTYGTVFNNYIINNTSNYNGGGFYSSGSPVVINNVFSGNQAANGGAINVLWATSALIANNLIIKNGADLTGGAIVLALSQTTSSLVNNVIANNSTPADGGAIWMSGSNELLINNTIVNNKAANGGALFCTSNSKPKLKNCILYGNSATADGAQLFLSDEPSDPDFSFCDVDGGQAAFGLNGNFFTGAYTSCISSAPLFAAPSAATGSLSGSLNDDWRLTAPSPCINTGDPVGPYSAADIAGNTRIVGSIIDLGAYEFGSTPVVMVGIKSYEQMGAAVTVYPNPFAVSATVKLSKVSNGVFEIYSQAGQMLRQEALSDTDHVTIYRDALQPGLYFFRWKDATGQSYPGKLLVE